MDQQIWIVGIRGAENYKEWEVVGVYDSKEKAFAACKNFLFFAARLELNYTAPEEPTPLPEHHVPMNCWPENWTEQDRIRWTENNAD
jgi:hypothetical protein